MADTIKIRRSTTPGAVPTTSQLADGELGLNVNDGIIYTPTNVGGTRSIVSFVNGAPKATSSSSDPVVGNDNTQGFSVGSMWYQTATQRIWTCISAATGAAQWVKQVFILASKSGTGAQASANFTPAVLPAGLYRMGGYSSYSGTVNSTMSVGWTDPNGATFGESFGDAASGNNFNWMTTIPFLIKNNTNITYANVINSGTASKVTWTLYLEAL